MQKSLTTLIRRVFAGALLACITFGFVAHAAVPRREYVQPTALYGTEIYFDVYRNGAKIGHHRVSFEKTGANLFVDIAFSLKIDVLFFTAYQYHYQSRSTWHDGMLQHLRTSVDDDGKLFHMDATQVGDSMQIAYGSSQYQIPAPILPTDHWNPAVLSDTRVLNTLTGKVNQVHIKSLGRDQVQTEAGPVSATHYVYTGDLKTEVWYDDDGRWVKLRFKGHDGSTIDYECRRCQGYETRKG